MAELKGSGAIRYMRIHFRFVKKIAEIKASTISSLIGEVMITSSDGDYLREVTSRW